jgi:hypothetical protein
MKAYVFKILDKVKPDKENTQGLNLAAVRRMTVQLTKLPLRLEIL